MRSHAPRFAVPDLLLTLVLATFVTLPFAGALWTASAQQASAVEKRELAPVPAWPRSFAQWLAFPAAFDAFATDRFGFRPQLLAGYRWIVASIFRDSVSREAFVGRHRWLYFADTRVHSLDDMRGVAAYSDAQLVNMVRQINARGELLAVRRIRYGFLVIPDKHTVYPQFLPRGVYGGFDRRRLNALDAAIAETGHDYYYDATDALRRDAPHSPFRMYYRSDTHWNPWGAYLGYRAWVAAAGERLGLKPIELRFDQFRDPRHSHHGDLSVMSGYRPRDPEIDAPADAGCGDIQPWKVSDELLRKIGTTANHMSIAHCAGRGGALVFNDSFMGLLRPYVTASYARSWLVWKYPNDPEFGPLVNKLHPDVVLVELVERFMQGFQRTDIAALVRELGVIGATARVDDDGKLVIGTAPDAFARPQAAVEATINRVERVGDDVHLIGWARMGDRSPEAVLAVVDGKVVAEAPLTEHRADVADATANPKLAWSGFDLGIPAAVIRAATAPLAIHFVNFDDYGSYRMPDGVEQQLQAAAREHE